MYRVVKIGSWIIDFMFCPEKYDEEAVIAILRDGGAGKSTVERVKDLMSSRAMNTGFTYANESSHRAIVVVGPYTSGSEFINTFSHEIYHVASAIASSIGYDLDGEGPAYIAGDTAKDLLDVVCELGCKHCHN